MHSQSKFFNFESHLERLQGKPNCCQHVSADLLENALSATWPNSNNSGPTIIPYSFSDILSEKNIQDMRGFTPTTLNNTKYFQESVRIIMNVWESASDNTIKFMEIDGPLSSGISIFNTPKSKLDSLNILGVTYLTGFTNTGDLDKVVIFLDDIENKWKKTYSFLTNPHSMPDIAKKIDILLAIKVAAHELGHALGLDHLDEIPGLKEALSNTEEGQYCSTLHSPSAIKSSISECGSCKIKYSILPGPLDKSLLSMAYGKNEMICLSNTRLNEFKMNGLETFSNSFGTTALHASMHTFLSNLISEPNEYLFSKTSVNILSDISLLTLSYLFNVPYSTILFYALTSSFKYTPEFITQNMPGFLNKQLALTASKTMYLFNTLNALYHHSENWPEIAATMFLTIGGTFTGSYVGHAFGSSAADICNKITASTDAEPEVLHDIELIGTGLSMEDTSKDDAVVSSNDTVIEINDPIPSKKNSFSNYFFSFFGIKRSLHLSGSSDELTHTMGKVHQT